ncbi:MAG: DNA gyrase inhibitor YacG [Pseudomonadota bacterium]
MSCPICGEPTEKRYRPFCSSRCANRDLGHWLRGDYAIPSNELEDMVEDAEPVAPGQEKPH